MSDHKPKSNATTKSNAATTKSNAATTKSNAANHLYTIGKAITDYTVSATRSLRDFGGFTETKKEDAFTNLGHIDMVIFDLGKVLIKTNRKKIIFELSKYNLAHYWLVENKKLTDLQNILFSIMEKNH